MRICSVSRCWHKVPYRENCRWAKTELLGWCPKQILHKKTPSSPKKKCAPVQVCEGLLPRMNERNRVKRMSYGSQSGRGARKRRFLKEELKLAMRQHGQLLDMWRNHAPKQQLWRCVVSKRVRGGFLRQQEWGWGSCCGVEVKKEVGETCRRHANKVSKDQRTLMTECGKQIPELVCDQRELWRRG